MQRHPYKEDIIQVDHDSIANQESVLVPTSPSKEDADDQGHVDGAAPKRNRFITFCLSASVVMNSIVLILLSFPVETFGVNVFDLFVPQAIMMFLSVSSVITIMGCILLLKRYKLGFWFYCATITLGLIETSIRFRDLTATEIGQAIGSTLSIWVLYRILRMKREKVPYWTQLKGIKKKDRSFIISIAIAIVVLSSLSICLQLHSARKLFLYEKAAMTNDKITIEPSDGSCEMTFVGKPNYTHAETSAENMISYGDRGNGPLWTVSYDGTEAYSIETREMYDNDMGYLKEIEMIAIGEETETIIATGDITLDGKEAYYIQYETAFDGVILSTYHIKLKGRSRYYNLRCIGIKSVFDRYYEEILNTLHSFKEK